MFDRSSHNTSSPFTPPPSYQLIAAQSWNVRSPPPANSNSAAAAAIFQGSTNIPSKPNRRVSVELYVTVSAEESGRPQCSYNLHKSKSSEVTIEALENGHLCVFRFLSKNEYRNKSSNKNPLWKTTPRTSNKHENHRSKNNKNNNSQAEQVSKAIKWLTHRKRQSNLIHSISYYGSDSEDGSDVNNDNDNGNNKNSKVRRFSTRIRNMVSNKKSNAQIESFESENENTQNISSSTSSVNRERDLDGKSLPRPSRSSIHFQSKDIVRENHELSWSEDMSCPLSYVTVHDVRDNLCVVSLSSAEHQWIFEMIFEGEVPAASFARLIFHQKQLEMQRARQNVECIRSSLRSNTALFPMLKSESVTSMLKRDRVHLIVEIISGYDLHAADNSLSISLNQSKSKNKGATSDPYVVVHSNGNILHKTKVIPRTTRPNWGLRTAALFVLSGTLEELFTKHPSGLVFEVRDFDTYSDDDSLGAVVVPMHDLFFSGKRRMEYQLTSTGCRDYGVAKWVKGTLSLRARLGTQEDVDYLGDLLRRDEEEETLETVGIVTELPCKKSAKGQNLVSGFVFRNKKVLKHKHNNDFDNERRSTVLYRVRPVPEDDGTSLSREKIKYYEDATRINRSSPLSLNGDDSDNIENELMIGWMTRDEIEEEVQKESLHWIEAGSGTLGELRVEILGCDKLPNKDLGFENKTDAIVSVAYENCVAQTDVVTDCLSPRWLPWSQRAFLFRMSHPCVPLHLAVFDYDDIPLVGSIVDEILDWTQHNDRLGQLTIGLTNFRPSTEYILVYDLFKDDSFANTRKVYGSITIRLRIEWRDERAVLYKSLSLPKPSRVNFSQRRTFNYTRWGVDKECDGEVYRLNTITSHIDELWGYQYLLVYVLLASNALVSWQSTFFFRMPFSGDRDIGIPLDSIIAYASLSYLIEHVVEFLPSFIFMCIAWLLLSTNRYIRSHPSKFRHCYSFMDFMSLFFVPHKRLSPIHIPRGFNRTEIRRHRRREQVLRSEFFPETVEDKFYVFINERSYEQNIIGENIDIATKVKPHNTLAGSFLDSVELLKFWIYPWQLRLGKLCRILRSVRNIVMWEQSYWSFWLTCASLVCAVICFFVPCLFILKWSARLIVHSLFLWTFFRKFVLKQKMPDIEKEYQKLQKEYDNATIEKRIKLENLVRLRDFRQVLFGRFLVQIPNLNFSRFLSNPKTSSSAHPRVVRNSYNSHDTMNERVLKECGENNSVAPCQGMYTSLKEDDMLLRRDKSPLTMAKCGEIVRGKTGLHSDNEDSNGVGNGYQFLRKCGDSSRVWILLKCFTYVFILWKLSSFAAPCLDYIVVQIQNAAIISKLYLFDDAMERWTYPPVILPRFESVLNEYYTTISSKLMEFRHFLLSTLDPKLWEATYYSNHLPLDAMYISFNEAISLCKDIYFDSFESVCDIWDRSRTLLNSELIKALK